MMIIIIIIIIIILIIITATIINVLFDTLFLDLSQAEDHVHGAQSSTSKAALGFR